MHERFPYPKTWNADDLRNALSKAGLVPHEVDMLIARFVDNMTMSEIVKVQGWTSRGSAQYCLRQALKQLRYLRFRL
jgi:hypothetical protein